MTVQVAERKGVPASSLRDGKVEFTECLKTSTVLFLTLPLSASTLNLISTPELEIMQDDALIVNVARGGIIDEEALVKALLEKKIGGAATDVFVEEPATLENNVLVRAAHDWAESERTGGDLGEMNGRLVLSPHIAWWAQSSIEKLRTTVGSNIESWAKGEVQNVVL
jgi:lactate dehydrogenase-like 2-hydroxyacid dehydrogenase